MDRKKFSLFRKLLLTDMLRNYRQRRIWRVLSKLTPFT